MRGHNVLERRTEVAACLVEFDIHVAQEAARAELAQGERSEPVVAAKVADERHHDTA
jgi:hypothetical protein